MVLPEVEMLDLAGPLQALHEANAAQMRYRIRVCAPRERIHSAQGVTLADLDPLPDLSSSEFLGVPRGSSEFLGVPRGSSELFGVPRGSSEFLGVSRGSSEFLGVPRSSSETDLRSHSEELRGTRGTRGTPLIVVPGMPYAATQKIERAVTRWLANAARAGAHLASVCTGSFALGEAGLLDGRRCTTHWSRTSELARRFPRAKVLEDRLYVTDGNVTTSAGIASGIDMALALIEQADGPIVAAEVAREMVVYLRRDGAQEQRSVYLDYRTHLHPGVHRVQDFIVQNPATRATLGELSEIAGMSSRNLTRTFREATGISVLDFTTRVRVELAKTLLNDPGLTMEAVAQRVGIAARQLRRLGIRRAHPACT